MAPKDEKHDTPERGGVSRRTFLKSTGVGSLAVGVAGVGEAEAQAVRAVGPGEVPITLTVNGRRVELKIEPRVTLLDAIRQRADMTGNKRGCDRGACGACTMIVDGRTVYACSTLAIDVQGKQIRTVEGLSTGNTLHPVQQAFCDVDALMCGFCTPGFVTTISAYLKKNPNPSLAEVREACKGNFCRCGTYPRVFEAALAAAKGSQA